MELDEIGLKIRNGRRALGMTQQELAEKVGYTSKVAISRIEKGDINISMDKMVEIANAIRVPISDFFDTYEKKETPDIFIGLSDQSKKRALEYIETLRKADLWQQQNGMEKDGVSELVSTVKSGLFQIQRQAEEAARTSNDAQQSVENSLTSYRSMLRGEDTSKKSKP